MLGSELGLGERGVLEPQGRVCVCIREQLLNSTLIKDIKSNKMRIAQ